ncbi:uncharacterized protein LOC119570917 [Penaeus monodon]|uniref:uncharacterized protein LOC119570917 n=1 Tax=Penaeus monodon TaxID=6687 RepID=UPI0018A79393|nr:uncharacterized protein LOC119570917 [Penaeus monodon]
MRNILINMKMSFSARARVLRCYIWPILKYGCETWNLTKDNQKRIESFEMCLGRIQGISGTEKVMTGWKRKLLNEVKQQMKFIGHIIRAKELEHLILTERIEGKRPRGRQRQKQMDTIKNGQEQGTIQDSYAFVEIEMFGGLWSPAL